MTGIENKEDPYWNYNLRQARIEKGYTVKELAEKAGTSAQMITSYERVRSFPPKDLQERVAEVLGKKADELFPENLEEITREVAIERRGGGLEIGIDNLKKTSEEYPPWRRLIEKKISELESLRNPVLLDDAPEEALYAPDNVEEVVDRKFDSDGVLGIMKDSLDERDVKVLKMRFGIDDSEEGYNGGKSLVEVGEALGITRSRVFQIESRAMWRLHSPENLIKLSEYYIDDALKERWERREILEPAEGISSNLKQVLITKPSYDRSDVLIDFRDFYPSLALLSDRGDDYVDRKCGEVISYLESKKGSYPYYDVLRKKGEIVANLNLTEILELVGIPGAFHVSTFYGRRSDLNNELEEEVIAV